MDYSSVIMDGKSKEAIIVTERANVRMVQMNLIARVAINRLCVQTDFVWTPAHCVTHCPQEEPFVRCLFWTVLHFLVRMTLVFDVETANAFLNQIDAVIHSSYSPCPDHGERLCLIS